MLQLIPNAKELWPKLWSVRLAGLAALLSGLEVGMQFFAPEGSSGVFSALSMLVAVAAAGARVVAQSSLGADSAAAKNTNTDK